MHAAHTEFVAHAIYNDCVMRQLNAFNSTVFKVYEMHVLLFLDSGVHPESFFHHYYATKVIDKSKVIL